MGFWSGSCDQRWSKITKRRISKKGARVLDTMVLAPIVVSAGMIGKQLPRVIRYAFVCIAVGLLAWNAFDYIDSEYETFK